MKRLAKSRREQRSYTDDDDDDDDNDHVDDDNTMSSTSASSCSLVPVRQICNDRTCDRQLVYKLFRQMRNVIDEALAKIDDELQRGFNLKRHPHSVIYRIGMRVSRDNLSDEVRAYVDESHTDQTSNVPLRNFVIDRAVDMIRRLRDDKPAENLAIIDGVIEACLVYQISLHSLLGLRRYIEVQSARFNEIHAKFDDLLQRYESAKANDNEQQASEMWSKITETQDVLDEQKTVLQRLINQTPFFVGRAREEHDFMSIYDNIDDTETIHMFLMSDFVKNEIARSESNTLRNAYSKIKHYWRDFAKTDVQNNGQKNDGADD